MKKTAISVKTQILAMACVMGLQCGAESAVWSDWIGIHGAAPSPWESAFLVPLGSEQGGYELVGDGTDPSDSHPAPSAAVFDATGQLQSAFWLDAPADAYDAALVPVENGLYFAHVIGNDGAVEAGLFDAATGQARFVRRLPGPADPDEIICECLEGNRIAIVQLLDDSVRVATLNEAGDLIFKREYQSSSFQAPSEGGLPGLSSVRTVRFDALPNGDGYFLGVTVTAQTIRPGIPPEISTEARLALLNLKPDGTIRWKETIPLPGNFTPSIRFAPDGAPILLAGETEMDLLLQKMAFRTILAKLTSTGGVDWAQRIPGALLGWISFGLQGKWWLYGTAMEKDSMFATDVVIAQFDPATRIFDAQARIDNPGLDLAYFSKETDDRVYLLFNTGGEDDAWVPSLVSFHRDLTHPVVRTYGHPRSSCVAFWSEQDDALLFSAFDSESNRVEAITVPPDLNVVGECPLWSEGSLQTVSPDLESTSLSLAPEVLEVSVSTPSIDLEEGELALQSWELSRGPLCGGGPPQPAAPVLALERAGNGLVLKFPTESGVRYTILEAGSLTGTFEPVGELDGTGAEAAFPVQLEGAAGFYRVRAALP